MKEFEEKEEQEDRLLSKGQSARIWSELYKVLDSSDVVIQVFLSSFTTMTPEIDFQTFLR